MSQLQCSPKKRLLEETRHRVSQLQHSITQVADVKARLKDNSLLVSSTTHSSLNLQMLRLLSAKAQRRKQFLKPCYDGIHWIALGESLSDEYPCDRVSVIFA